MRNISDLDFRRVSSFSDGELDQNEVKIKLNMKNKEDFKVFKKVRDLKDNF